MFPYNPNDIHPGHTPHDINSNYGFFHVYAFTMTLGMILAILAAYYQLRKRKVPIEPLIFSIIFIIPAALLGGSFFGKVNRSDNPWYTNFYFWNAGMSIHGGVLFGLVVGLIYFYIVGRKSHISLWVYADAIVPNILLGQIVGRWGNFFNHELLGKAIDYHDLLWLPPFIRDNLWQWDPNMPNMPEMMGGHIVFREPVFLYESFGDFCAWFFIIFVLPHIGRWGAKIKSNEKSKIVFFKRPLFYDQQHPEKQFITYKQAWNDYYYNHQPSMQAVYDCDQVINTKWKEATKIFEFHRQKYRARKKLNALHNRENKFIIKSGVSFGVYFFLWNFVRYWIETRRNDFNLFIVYNRPLDTALLWTFVAIGLIIALLAQFVIPNLTRKNGWQYEKTYQKTWLLSSWPFDFFKALPKKLITYDKPNNRFNLDQSVRTFVNNRYRHQPKPQQDYDINSQIIANTLQHKIIIKPHKETILQGNYNGVFDFKIDLAQLNWSKIICANKASWEKYKQLRHQKVMKYVWKEFCDQAVFMAELKQYLNNNYQSEVAHLLINLFNFPQESFAKLSIVKINKYYYFRAKCASNEQRYTFSKKFLILMGD